MARPVISPMTVQATAPETFTVLHQRMRVAEEQTESLIKDLARLGVSCPNFNQTPARPSAAPDGQRCISPFHARTAFVGDSDMLWKNCESLVNRICRMESLIQTLKLKIFRLHTEKELNPKHSAQLQERLSALQDEHAQEMKCAQMEVMRLRQKLSEESEEKERVQDENERLGAALEMATATKTDVAIAAEELRVTKNRMSRRLHELQERLSQETSLRASLEESQVTMLHRVQDLEKVVEAERKEVQVLQQDSQTLRSDAQASWDRQQREEQRSQQLEQESAHLKAELEARDSIISQLREEGKNAQSSLSKEQAENAQLRWEISTLRETAEKVQALNDQLDRQCCELSSSLRSLTMENAKLLTDHQATLKAEQEKMNQKLHEQDLLLDAARANITAELQAAQCEQERVQRELVSLRAEHAQCVQRACLSEEKMAMRKELQESTIARLRRELETAIRERDAGLNEKESLVKEKNKTMQEITEDKNKLEAELTENKLELSAMKSTLQSQEEENRRLMDRLASMEHQQHAQQQVEQALSELTDSKNKLAYEKGKLQTRVQQLEAELQSLADASSENQQLRKMNTALEAKYSQVNAEFSSSRIHMQRSEAQLKQAQSVLERKEQDFALAIKSRDEALRESQKMKGQMEGLEERERQKVSTLQRQLDDVKEDNSKVSGTLENVLASHSRLQHALEKLQMNLGCRDSEITGLRKDRSQNQQRIQRLESELEESQSRLLSMDMKQRSQVEPLRKALEVSREDNKKLALSLEQSLQNNSSLQSKLNHVQDELDSKELQLQQLQTCRNQEAEEAKVEAKLFTERLESLKKQFRTEREAARKGAQRDTSELKKALDEATSKSADLSRANRELRHKVTELEKTVANQKVKLKSQKTQIRHHLETKATGTQHADKRKDIELELKQLELLKEQYQKKNHEQSQKIQKFLTEMTALQGEIQILAKSQHEAAQLNRQQESRLEAERKHRQELENKCQSLEDTVKQLKRCKEATEKKLKEASVESEQISVNLEEAHQWFKSKFDSLQLELVRNRQRVQHPAPSEGSWGEKESVKKESEDSLSISSQAEKDAVDERPVKLPSHSTLNRWEAKQELKLMSRKYQAEQDRK